MKTLYESIFDDEQTYVDNSTLKLSDVKDLESLESWIKYHKLDVFNKKLIQEVKNAFIGYNPILKLQMEDKSKVELKWHEFRSKIIKSLNYAMFALYVLVDGNDYARLMTITLHTDGKGQIDITLMRHETNNKETKSYQKEFMSCVANGVDRIDNTGRWKKDWGYDGWMNTTYIGRFNK